MKTKYTVRMKQEYSDQEIIVAIQSGGIENQRMTQHLFDQYKGLVIQGMNKYKLSEEDSLDAYADSIVGFNRQIMLGKFRGDSKVSSYLFTIFFNQCKNKVRSKLSKRQSWVDELPEMPTKARNVLDELIASNGIEIWAARIKRLGKTCRQILWDWGFHGYTLQEIADRLGYANVKSVSSKKYTCIQKLKALIDKEKGTDLD